MFSGHETFTCKSLWLKKGYDFVSAGYSFNSDDAVVKLGVGKNMVSSIRYWMKAFGVLDSQDNITPFGEYIFNEETGDPFLEDISTLWLLHFNLVWSGYASIYNLLFLQFHKERNSFNKSHIVSFLKRKLNDAKLNVKTVEKDFSVMLRMYNASSDKVADDSSSILIDLNLLRRRESLSEVGADTTLYEFNEATKAQISPLVFLYAVKSAEPEDKIVSFDRLLDIASVLCMSMSEMYETFRQLSDIDANISFSNAAGEQLFVMNQNLSLGQILDMIYAR